MMLFFLNLKNGKWETNNNVNKSRILDINQNNISLKGPRSGGIFKETRIK